MLSSSCDIEPRKQQHQQQPPPAEHQAPRMNTNNSNSSPANGAEGQQTDQDQRRYRPQKYCSVCGDKAIACNFNAVTCESCKAFFRRNAFKEQRLKCLFENRCVIDRVTRRFCSKCRLLKCFQIGMKREWILTDEQKQIKRVKILQNKQSKLTNTSSSSSYSSAPNDNNNSSPVNNISNNSSSPPPILVTNEASARQRQSSYSSSISVCSSSLAPVQQPAATARHQVETRDACTSTVSVDEYSPEFLPLHYCSLASQCHYCSIITGTDVEANASSSSSLSGARCDSSQHLVTSHKPAHNDHLYAPYPPPVATPNQYEETGAQQQQHQPQLHMLTAPQGAYLSTPVAVHHELYQQELPIAAEINASNPFAMALDAKSLASPANERAQRQAEPRGTVVVPTSSPSPPTELFAPGANQDESSTNSCTRCSVICVYGSSSDAASTEELERSGYVMWRGEMYLKPAHTELEARERVESLEFNANEKQLIEELLEATRFMFSCSRDDCSNHMKNTASNDSMNNFVYFCDAALRRLIKTVKQVKAFRLLSMDDQIVLLKTACFKILLLRSTFHYQQHLNGWKDLKTGKVLQLEFLKRAKKSFVFERHSELVTQIPEPLRRDRLILSIMSMALLFDPNISLKHSNSVGLDNLIYLSLLRKYLLNTQPDPLTKYELLVAALQKVNACNEEYNIFFSEDFQPGQITPLLVEIFDISINNSDI